MNFSEKRVIFYKKKQIFVDISLICMEYVAADPCLKMAMRTVFCHMYAS